MLKQSKRASFQLTWASLHLSAAIMHLASSLYHMQRILEKGDGKAS